MKVILTEEQFKRLIEEEVVLNYLNESIFEKGDLKLLIKGIRNALITGVAATTIIAAIGRANISDENKEKLIDMVKTEAVANNNKKEAADSTFQQRVDAVANYMAYALKNQGYSMKSTGLKPETLVKVAQQTGFDLPFMMAAAHLESCFGATPRAQKTNSVFSVGSYDNGKNAVTYANPNDSVEGYVDLLNSNYLVNGKTISDFMAPGGFVDKYGHRYASNKKYEAQLKSIRDRIIRMFPELA